MVKRYNIDTIHKLLKDPAYTQGQNIYDLSFQLPLLFVFLRHLGCAFAHRTLLDLKMQYLDIQMEGAEFVFVHMTSIEEAEDVFDLYNLKDILHIASPKKELYKAFGLKQGETRSIFSPSIWLFGSGQEGLHNDEIDPILGDPLQMPGIFLYYEGEIATSYYHKKISDRPDYRKLAAFPIKKMKEVSFAPTK